MRPPACSQRPTLGLHTAQWFAWAVLALLSLALMPLPASARSSTGPRTLVVLDSSLDRADFSSLFTTLEAQGLELTFKAPKDESPALSDYEQYNYDHLLLLAPSAKSLSSDLTPQKLVGFLKKGGNVLFALSPSVSELYRDLAREFSLEFEERNTAIVDHLRFTPSLDDEGHHSTLVVGPLGGGGKRVEPSGGVVPNTVVFSSQTLDKARSLPLLFRGVGHKFAANPQAFPLLRAPTSSYSADPASAVAGGGDAGSDGASGAAGAAEGGVWLGSEVDSSLVSAFQLRDNSARAVWTGSIDLFSDRFWKAKSFKASSESTSYPATLNSLFASDVLSWLTQSHGVLRIESVSHERVRAGADDVREEYEEYDDGEGDARRVQKMYRINDTVVFTVELSQHTPDAGWVPAPRDLDLQVSAVMIDPYITAHLSAEAPSTPGGDRGDGAARGGLVSSSTDATSAGRTRYSCTLRLPDKHGVFTFSLDWARPGWSYLRAHHRAPVRPFNSDEYPRFLSAAWPYVAGSFSTFVAFVAFALAWTLSASTPSSSTAGRGAAETAAMGKKKE